MAASAMKRVHVSCCLSNSLEQCISVNNFVENPSKGKTACESSQCLTNLKKAAKLQ